MSDGEVAGAEWRHECRGWLESNVTRHAFRSAPRCDSRNKIREKWPKVTAWHWERGGAAKFRIKQMPEKRIKARINSEMKEFQRTFSAYKIK